MAYTNKESFEATELLTNEIIEKAEAEGKLTKDSIIFSA